MPALPCSSSSGPLRGAPVAVLDFETTGVAPGARFPVQIAVMTCRLGDDRDPVWSTLVKPPIPIPAEASAVHGITDADVADAPQLAEILDPLLALVDGHHLCAYNLPFDWMVLKEGLELCGRADEVPAFDGLDPLVWVKQTDKYLKGKTLEAAAGRRGITFAAHDAAGDVGATAQLMPLILRQLAVDGHIPVPALHAVDRFARWQRHTALAQERDYADYRRRKGLEDPRMTWHDCASVAPHEKLPPPA